MEYKKGNSLGPRVQVTEWGSFEWLYEPPLRTWNRPTVGLVSVNPGRVFPLHRHFGVEQLVYVVSGSGRQEVGEEVILLKPGTLVHIPAGATHEIVNSGQEVLKTITINMPIQLESFLSELKDYDDDYKNQVKEHLSLSDLVTPGQLQAIQDKLAELYNLAMVTVDDNLTPYSKMSNPSRFCRIVNKTQDGIRICRRIQEQGWKKNYQEDQAFIFECCPGVINMAVPVRFEGKCIGWIIAGQAFFDPPSQDDIAAVRKHFGGLDVNLEELVAAYRELQLLTKGRAYVARGSIRSIADYLVDTGVRGIMQEKMVLEMKARMELEKMVQEAERQALQAQINPHFLYNALNAIVSLTFMEEAPRTRDAIYFLSKMLRYTLRSAKELTSLREELEHVSNYLALQEIRFGDRLQIEIKVPEELYEIYVPVLTLQPLVENALVHGLEPKRNDCRLSICARREGEWVLIGIRDNGIGIDQEKLMRILEDDVVSEKGTGIGLKNVNKRLQHYLGPDCGMEIDSRSGGGTTIVLRLKEIINGSGGGESHV